MLLYYFHYQSINFGFSLTIAEHEFLSPFEYFLFHTNKRHAACRTTLFFDRHAAAAPFFRRRARFFPAQDDIAALRRHVPRGDAISF